MHSFGDLTKTQHWRLVSIFFLNRRQAFLKHIRNAEIFNEGLINIFLGELSVMICFQGFMIGMLDLERPAVAVDPAVGKLLPLAADKHGLWRALQDWTEPEGVVEETNISFDVGEWWLDGVPGVTATMSKFAMLVWARGNSDSPADGIDAGRIDAPADAPAEKIDAPAKKIDAPADGPAEGIPDIQVASQRAQGKGLTLDSRNSNLF
ncbi:hypothetical protein DFP72DRAFT_1078294 [Ephemerocybe angulata]|uniref:Uncharacterized protein n=1 Tax=Ephemerocybe angulata TaxID=980116 RepID=A0A8H6LXE0_9AGAR|nr:hypothetical protein DFP72DRAFT_1078511 [Tulosesus angulatus]KAF6744666.1 hypothetical protein DFP72DRAFT_1078294 [Tulosesus angulatus]